MHRCFICYKNIKFPYQLLPEKDDISCLKNIYIDKSCIETVKCNNIYFIYYITCLPCLDKYLTFYPKSKHYLLS